MGDNSRSSHSISSSSSSTCRRNTDLLLVLHLEAGADLLLDLADLLLRDEGDLLLSLLRDELLRDVRDLLLPLLCDELLRLVRAEGGSPTPPPGRITKSPVANGLGAKSSAQSFSSSTNLST